VHAESKRRQSMFIVA